MIEEKYDQVRQLINMGKVRGCLLYDEVNDMLPAKVRSWEQIDDLLSTFERCGIGIEVWFLPIAPKRVSRRACPS